jgi:hypothetical protein
MPAAADFRAASFDVSRIQASGKYVGKNVYWKLYSIENIVRIIINSVLTAQIGPNWWSTAVDTKIAGKASRIKWSYANQPWHTQPGFHEIYYIFLPDLNEILRANSNLFLPSIPDVHQWIAKIEQIRLPRNVIGHMNWPSTIDRKRVDVFLADIVALTALISRTSLIITIP